MRQRIHDILEGNDPVLGTPFLLFSSAAILLAAISYSVGTMPGLSVGMQYALRVFDALFIVIFATEYGLRLASSPKPLRYALSFWGLVDLIAFLPALLTLGADLRTTRLLRLILLARLLKLVRLSHAMDTLVAAMEDVAYQLAVFVLVTLVVLFLAAVGIYLFEHKAQPEVFKSVPHAMWWAVVTLSTVGYGDIVPVTPGGKFFTGLVLLIGLAIVAVPTGLISAALVSNTEKNRKEKKNDNTQSIDGRRSGTGNDDGGTG